ncbi:ABC transporter substrate-binding protein [Christiangramia fulva]|uniref:ABC transporter substrate-binding protein n=1 Tax=Christiangramia fulva TaxID=2126553 RepID=A0A2R3Z7Y1_9FLAO|nr:substrate-binding domain-containing protein [Christiangramia fulva]AVR46380.1 ABC transporter substrate-binding protein [Christiangramia fulva]
MKTIKIGGVPEHFNLPWHLAIENDNFKKEDINLLWKDFPEGTGAMCNALRSGELDAAVILTEGIVRDIINGNECKIIQNFIGSPLIWGIHVAAESKYKNIGDLEGTKAAISRMGSGSHLMAYVNAQHQGWDTDTLKFEIVDNVEGAVKALKEGRAQYFMWEHFTTKPLVDNHTFRLVADCPTPWPCFVIAVRNESLRKDPERIQRMLKVINTETKNFKLQPKIDVLLAERYQQKLEDIRKWLDLTHWSQEQIAEDDLKNVQDTLLRLNLIPEKKENSFLIY